MKAQRSFSVRFAVAPLVFVAVLAMLGVALVRARPGPAPWPRPNTAAIAAQGSDERPGTIRWVFQADGAIVGAPAIVSATEAASPARHTIYVATRAGSIYALDGEGHARWRYNHAESTGRQPMQFEAAPAVADDGTIYVGDDVYVPNYVIALDPNGTLRWEWEDGGVNSAIDSSPAIDRRGRVLLGGTAGGMGWTGGSLLAFEGDGTPVHGFPVQTGPVLASAAVLGDDRIVFVADGSADMAGPTPTRNQELPTPTWPPATDTARPSATSTAGTLPPTADSPTETPTASPTLSATAETATPDSTSDATATVAPATTEATPGRSTVTPTVWETWPRLYLPRALAETARGPSRSAVPGHSLRSPGQDSGWHPSRFHIVSDGPLPVRTYDLDPVRASSLAATGSVVVFWMRPREGTWDKPRDGTPRLAAFDARIPARQVWQLEVQGGLAGAPVLGARHRLTGAVRLYYHDAAGRVYSYHAQTRPSVEPSLGWSAEVPAMPGEGSAMGAGCPALGRRKDEADDIVYVPCGGARGDAEVVALEALTGSREWSTLLAGQRISSAVNLGPDGTLYVGTDGGKLYAIRTESSGLSPDAEWPSFRSDARNSGRAPAIGPTPTMTRAACPVPPLCTPGPELTPTPGPTPRCPPCRKR